MDAKMEQNGFSLMEVNMAVFVMAVGILSLIVLFPLGLRESTQGQADLKQSMFADYLLNQAVAAASYTNVPWSEWKRWVSSYRPPADDALTLDDRSVPSFVREYLDKHTPDWDDAPVDNKQYRIRCCPVPGFSDRIMGIMVISSEQGQKWISKYSQFSNNVIYYAEAMFQGDGSR